MNVTNMTLKLSLIQRTLEQVINIFSFKVGQVLDNGDLKVTSVIAGGHVWKHIQHG